ncbi:MAG: 3-deoxy-manno-octulosonate cytidylyltransferase [Ignavibacteria bacterium]|nr:3-deoxy-manno-octulosonate cytidylyltransferase [Ignavibacteria bacterium]
MTGKILIVIQARRGSTRLPDKIFLPLAGKPLIYRMIERVKSAKTCSEIVVATTTDKDDDKVEAFCKENEIKCFRGHPTDLLDRHYKAAKEFKADIVVKIPSDCPLICPDVIDRVLNYYLSNSGKFDFVSNLHPSTYPDGNDVEVMPVEILETAFKEATHDFEREHTTPFIWERPERFRIGNVEWETGLNFSMSHRFTIDYPEDYEFIKRVYDELFDKKKIFKLSDIMMLLDKKPEIKSINAKYAGVNWYRNHLDKLKTITVKETRNINH